MKNVIYIWYLLFCTVFSCQKQSVIREISNEALSQKIKTIDGKKVDISSILNSHKGEIVMIDFWASWCQDCIKAMPKTKELIAKNPNVTVLYFSLDRKEDAWKKGIVKHNLSEKNQFWFDEGWKNTFNNEIDLNWIPRIMIINQQGKIALYSAKSPENSEIQKTINALSSN